MSEEYKKVTTQKQAYQLNKNFFERVEMRGEIQELFHQNSNSLISIYK